MWYGRAATRKRGPFRRLGMRVTAGACHVQVTCALAGLLIVAWSGCGLGSGASHGRQGGGGGPAYSKAYPVSFDSSVSYVQALRELTDAGYQPTVACGTQADVAAGQVIEGLRWQPAGQRDRFDREHRLFVGYTPLAAPGPDPWTTLATLPGVTGVNQQVALMCPNSAAGPANATPLAGTPTVFTQFELGTVPYARATFAASINYDTALAAISDLGVRLGDYCYETGLEAFNHGQTPWKPMGQESAFAASHTLIVAPAPLTTAHTWLDQLGALPTVTSVQANYTPAC